MTVVKINAIAVPEGMGSELERRFAERARLVEGMPGFLGFELLRPVSGDARYFVVTHWTDDESFQGWVGSQQFQQGHAHAGSGSGSGSGSGGGRPVGMSSDLLEFEVVDLAANASPPEA